MTLRNALLPLLLLTALLVAGKDDNTLEQWTKSQQTPEYVDGVRMFRPVISNGKMSFGDFIVLDTHQSNDVAFVRALAYTINELDPETESIETIDYDLHRFVVNRAMSNDEGHLFEFAEAVEIDNGVMAFMIPEIVVRYKDKLIINKKVPFSKFNLDKKEQQRKFVEEFAILNSRYLQQMANATAYSTIENVSDWASVKKGKAAKGMNFTEVLLTEGKPDNITESDNNITKWMYGSTLIIIFNNGKVERIVNF